MKKRCVYLLAFCIFFIYSIIIAKTLNIYNKASSIHVNSTAVTSHVVVIDAGHGKPDEGAIGLYGTTEEAINLKIALKLQSLIEESGGIVYLTRSDENGIYSTDSNTIRQKKVSDIKNRVNIGNQKDVDIFVSIHLNKYPESIYKGWQTFYQSDNDDSKRLAISIQNSLNNVISTENNRVPLPLNGVYIMDNIENTVVTVECGFLSNEEEAKKLQQDDYQEQLAWGIFIGIQDFYK